MCRSIQVHPAGGNNVCLCPAVSNHHQQSPSGLQRVTRLRGGGGRRQAGGQRGEPREPGGSWVCCVWISRSSFLKKACTLGVSPCHIIRKTIPRQSEGHACNTCSSSVRSLSLVPRQWGPWTIAQISTLTYLLYEGRPLPSQAERCTTTPHHHTSLFEISVSDAGRNYSVSTASKRIYHRHGLQQCLPSCHLDALV